jgi:hypothetical protein
LHTVGVKVPFSLVLIVAAASATTVVVDAGGAPELMTVTVEKTGFSERRVDLPNGRSGKLGSFGVVLFNPNELDAREVTVVVEGFTATGTRAVSDRLTVLVVPPRTRYFVGGGWAIRGTSVKRLRVRATAGNWIRLDWRLPRVSRVRATWPSGGDAGVTGTVANVHGEFNLATDALVGVVLFGKGGEIVGGANAPFGRTLSPGASGRLAVRVYGGRRTFPVTARVSVEPRLTPYR